MGAAMGQDPSERGPNPRWRCRRAPQRGAMACLIGMWRWRQAHQAPSRGVSVGRGGGAWRDEEDQEGQSRKQTSAGHGRPMVADSRDGGKGFGL